MLQVNALILFPVPKIPATVERRWPRRRRACGPRGHAHLRHVARRADPFWAGGNWVVASNQRAPKEMIGWDRYLESNMRPMLP